MRWTFSIFCSQPTLFKTGKSSDWWLMDMVLRKKGDDWKEKQVFLLLLNLDFYQRSPEMVQCSGFGRFRSPVSTSPKTCGEKKYQLQTPKTGESSKPTKEYIHWKPSSCWQNNNSFTQKTPHLFLLIPKAVMAAQQVIPVDTSRSNEQCSASQIRINPAASPGPFTTEVTLTKQW